MNHNPRRLLMGGAVLSGFASAALGFVALETLWMVPGVLFAVCVIIPWTRLCEWRWERTLSIGVMCVVGYVVAHGITRIDFLLAPIGAAIGTSIMLGIVVFDPASSVRRVTWRAIGVGSLVAPVFTIFAFVPEGWWGLLLGIPVWQVAVAATLSPAIDTDRKGCCLACGYDLRGTAGRQCPECGAGGRSA